MTLSATELQFRRGGRVILDQVSLTAEAGEFIAVIGPNGAGKSTLLSVLAGLLHPDSGSVMLKGERLTELSGAALARLRAYLPQNPRCEWPISVERLVGLGLTPTLPSFGGFSSADERRISAALDSSDLTPYRLQAATSLSGGELARAMLARAFVGEPQTLIVDEPIAGLDPKHAIDAMRRLKRFATDGRLVIASVHDLTLAARHATRVIAMHAGRIDSDGPIDSTLTTAMIRRVFEVEARVVTGDAPTYIDFSV